MRLATSMLIFSYLQTDRLSPHIFGRDDVGLSDTALLNGNVKNCHYEPAIAGPYSWGLRLGLTPDTTITECRPLLGTPLVALLPR